MLAFEKGYGELCDLLVRQKYPIYGPMIVERFQLGILRNAKTPSFSKNLPITCELEQFLISF